jgi:hypothetical protein
MPDIELQRAAMKKLAFLVGKWSGHARLSLPSGDLELLQTEEAAYKLDGLLLTIEGIGRNKADGKPALQALGIISYDDEAGTHRMRAFNDGRWLETDVRIAGDGRELTWGFALREIQTRSVLRIDQSGDWTEVHEIVISSQPPRRLMELKVSPQR